MLFLSPLGVQVYGDEKVRVFQPVVGLTEPEKTGVRPDDSKAISRLNDDDSPMLTSTVSTVFPAAVTKKPMLLRTVWLAIVAVVSLDSEMRYCTRRWYEVGWNGENELFCTLLLPMIEGTTKKRGRHGASS